MQNPSELYRFETDADPQELRASVMIVTLGGFVDAGNTQRLLSDHLLATTEGSVVASFDVDQLLDYRGRRPGMVFDTNRWLSYEDPCLALHRLVDRDGTPFFLLTGPEPDYQWERVVEAIRQLVVALGVDLVISAHGIPMAVPHTRPIGMTAHATDPRLIPEQLNPFGRVEVPGSLASLLELRLGESGHDAMGFAIHVPHYLAQSEFADGAVTALNAITGATALNLSIDDLVAAAGLNRAEIAQELAGSEEVAQVVAALERQYDTFVEGLQKPSLLATDVSELPSADEIGAELEQFLRNVADDDGDGPTA
ncbi:PAC2 family protein [Phycicoccus sp. SLBN-51]|uniref:PAC2 family protein n=1 Tax=Phycicoccus sp. SLBN-51 TaxID=2768447 RepID=UPI00114EBCD3|nr:PAC2 family protein [Phycicoccus sp. SLBN-51]TQJ50268.1 PAC2 family protein [Phycicoccus sp. SLBN-51]